MNQIVDIKKYRENIIALWHECFGDERDYIEFFLDSCPNKLCIGCFENNVLASMLFLLNGSVDGFLCKYIYAACTAHEFRSKGLMGGLIEYSKKYCAENKIEMLFLVPAEESLYGYYAKFGFIPKMQRAEITLKGGSGEFKAEKTTDIKSVAKRRLRLLSSIKSFAFDTETTEYTVEEFLHTGGEIYSQKGENGFLAFVVREGKKAVVKELLPDFDSNFTIILDLFENLGAENVYIHAPLVYNNTDIGLEATKCGMLYPITENAKSFIKDEDIFYSGMYLD